MEMTDNILPGQTNSRPNPDPTLLTTQNLIREIGMLRELLEARILATEHRLNALDDKLEKVPQETAILIEQYKEIFAAKLGTIETQFADHRRSNEQFIADNKSTVETSFAAIKNYVDAAFIAAKEAVAEQNKSNSQAITKSETAFAKQIDQLNLMLQTMTNGINDKIEDIKNRLNIIERMVAEGGGHSKGVGDLWGWIVGGISLLLALAMFMASRSNGVLK